VVYGRAFFNEHYEKAGYDNLTSVNDDKKTVALLFELMQIAPENIIIFTDATYDEIDEAFKVIKSKAKIASTNPTMKVLFVVWYGGHGEIADG
jgi:predicted AAA+ superfamily ATPase